MGLCKQFCVLVYTRLLIISMVDCLSSPYELVILPDNPVRVQEGEDLSLYCSVHRYGQVMEAFQNMFKPIWELPIHFSGTTVAKTKPANYRYASTALELSNLQPEDSGKYTCSITIDGWNLKEYARVTIYSKYNTKDLELSIEPSQVIQITEGDSLRVNCSINRIQQWGREKLLWESMGKAFKQTWVDNTTVTLEINDATEKDAGSYKCKFYGSWEPPKWKALFITVVKKNAASKKCSPFHFMCERSQYCIFRHYICDGQKDCNDGSDELHCGDPFCEYRFSCKNGKCIDEDLVCDKFHSNDCGDWSDESCLDPESSSGNKSIIAGDIDKGDEEHMTWLKTTVYAVIGCLVSIVLIISIIVIVIFRLRMKKEALRQSEIAMERRHTSARGTSDDVVPEILPEQQPFIGSGGGRPSFGNIIVNVNNGVQFVPGTNFRIMEAPPSYSDVEQEIHEIQASPPPDYSTIDRNPQRPDFLQLVSTNDSDNLINDNNNNNNNVVSARSNRQNSTPTGAGNSRQNRPQMQHVSVQTTQNQNRSGTGSNQSGLHRNDSNGSHTRPKRPNIDVQGGQIILTDQQLATVPGRTQTVNTNSNRPAQIQVQGGQIVFSSGNTSSRNSSLPSVSTARVQNSVPVNCVTNSADTPVVTSTIQPTVCEANSSALHSSSPVVIGGQGDMNVDTTRDVTSLCTPIEQREIILSEQATLQCRPNSAPLDVSLSHDQDCERLTGNTHTQHVICSDPESPPVLPVSSSQSSSNANDAVQTTTSENSPATTSPILVTDNVIRGDNSTQNRNFISGCLHQNSPESSNAESPGQLQLRVSGGRILLSNNQNTFPRMSSSQRSVGSPRESTQRLGGSPGESSPNRGQINVEGGNIVLS